VLSPIVTQLTPEFAAAPPLPHAVLTDQLGAMLAMAVGEIEGRVMPELQKKIQARIRERCTEPQLTADDVAHSLDIPPRFLHRVLAATHRSFASMLLDARIDTATAMLRTPAKHDLTVAEISRHVGFLNAAHFAREVRKRTGHPPTALRRLAH
jgi:AraC-like DNA-binding protein